VRLELALALALAIAACSAPKRGPVCGAIHCTIEEVCDRTDPAGPTCIPADGDLDGDGIPNSMDLCDHVPGGLYDEDGDGIGDECDPCPIAPPPPTPDPDGDAVDRPCDPDPSTPGDQIIAFSGFHDLPAAWTPATPAAWQIENGELVVTPPDAAQAQVLTIPLAKLSNYVAVMSAWRIDGTIANAGVNEVAVAALDNRPAGTASMSCGGLQQQTGDFLRLDTDLASQSQSMPNLFDTANLYRATANVTGTLVGCALVTDTSDGAVQATLSPGTMSEAHLVATGAIARFQYVLVVAR
jgi:hypothetical protein